MNHLAFSLACVLLVPGAFAGSINFETGASCDFDTTVALTTTYSGQGVTFAGPGGNNGGAILDQCSGFGIDAHSGTDFLAFNTDANLMNGGVPEGPETITFSSLVSNVGLYVGGNDTGASYTLNAYGAGSNLLGTTSGTPTGGQWLQLVLDVSNISSLQLTFTTSTAVVDDLSWNATGVPEPSTLGLLCLGAAAMFAALRKRRPAR
jgi:hypothetical protein